jgi:hypothetical protein
MPLGDASRVLDGFTGLTTEELAGDPYFRVGDVLCVKIDGPFNVRCKNSVDHVKDGWLCKGEDGHMFGVEAAVFWSQLTVHSDVQPLTFNAQVGVAYDHDVQVPVGDGQPTYTSFTLSPSTTLPTGLTFSPSTHHVSGTPAAATEGAYYLEFDAVFSSGSTSVQRNVVAVFPGA